MILHSASLITLGNKYMYILIKHIITRILESLDPRAILGSVINEDKS